MNILSVQNISENYLLLNWWFFTDDDTNILHMHNYFCSSWIENSLINEILLGQRYNILKEEEICQRQEEDISKVSGILSISRDAACILLRHYKWLVYISLCTRNEIVLAWNNVFWRLLAFQLRNFFLLHLGMWLRYMMNGLQMRSQFGKKSDYWKSQLKFPILGK